MLQLMSIALSQRIVDMSLNDVIEHILRLLCLDDDILWDIICQLSWQLFCSLEWTDLLAAP